jgi:hypothetical protein
MTTTARLRASPIRLLLGAALALAAAPAPALDLRPDAAGVEVDLLPIVASAAAGELGGSLQLWAGAGRNRLRVVGAHLHYPDAFVSSPFAAQESSVAAVLYDRFFRAGFTGPWVAAGAEYWWSRIGLESGGARSGSTTPVLTAGAGWVFPAWRGLYLNPWGAVHASLDTSPVAVGGERFHPRALAAELSLKVGWGATGSP